MLIQALTLGIACWLSGDSKAARGAAEFVYQEAPFPECHASTIAESAAGGASGGGLVCAWFGGTEEGAADVGVWLSRREGSAWTRPVEVAAGVEDGATRVPCWNPVLFQPRGGPLLLFYKVGPSPRKWWGRMKVSEDGGRTWSASRRLPDGILGPIKNKPVQLADGTIVCGSSTEDNGWRLHFERTRDLGKTWETTGPIHDGREFSAIQPTLLVHAEVAPPAASSAAGGDVSLQALCRSQQGRIVETWSSDGGKTWGAVKATSLPNPNSGIDGVTLADRRQLLVYNATKSGRSPLNVAVSGDGADWKPLRVLETDPAEFSYPAVIQAADGTVHITYTWKRSRIKHVALTPSELESVGPTK